MVTLLIASFAVLAIVLLFEPGGAHRRVLHPPPTAPEQRPPTADASTKEHPRP